NRLMRNQTNGRSAQSRRRSRYCPRQSTQAGTATG
ncbi:electron transport complex protein RnfC, partial [Escherichia coli TA255]